MKRLVTVPVLALAAWAAITTSQPAIADVTAAYYSPTSPMVAVTANIGRKYDSGTKVREVMNRIKRKLYDVSNGRPRFIGWQEIDEDDPAAEMRILKDVYRYEWGWRRTLYRWRSDGSRVNLKVPETANAVEKFGTRVAFGSSGMKGVSPTRWITVTRYRHQNISFINTHFIAGAWGCTCEERKSRWRTHWRNLWTEVHLEHDAGLNVILTGDFNRRAGAGWSPADIHRSARHVRNAGVDHIVAVPRAGWKVTKPRWADGSYKQGSWWIGIDGHWAQWVTLRFLPL